VTLALTPTSERQEKALAASLWLDENSHVPRSLSAPSSATLSIGAVHLRRALLLFAIVLGLAAVAASVSRPGRESDPLRTSPPTSEEQPRTSTVAPAPEGAPAAVDVTFPSGKPRARGIEAGQAATVLVEVDEAGQVGIEDLGMSAVADPLTPARFDVLTRTTGRHAITFVPAGAEDLEKRVGTLVVR
jgi:hypothetical protein